MKSKKMFAILTAAALCLTMSSCGKSAPEPETASKAHVYREDRIELADGLDVIDKVMCRDEKIYMLGEKYIYGENDIFQSVQYILNVINIDGTVEKETELDFDVTSYSLHISEVCVDGDGVISIVIQSYSDESFTVYRFSSDGEMLGKFRVSNDFKDVMNGTLIRGFIPLENSRYLIGAGVGAAVITADGDVETVFKDNTPADSAHISGLCQMADGRTFMVYTVMTWDESIPSWIGESELVELDLEDQKLGERYRIATSGTFLNGTDKYDLLISRESGLAGYDIETGETEVILDWIKSGMDINSIPTDTINALPDGRIICQNNPYRYHGSGAALNYDDVYISLLTEIPPEELPDRKLIKLFALTIDTEIRQQILSFNRNNLEYEIELTSYADYENGSERMNMDMISGNVPDVLILGKDELFYDIPADSYISKGLLANLYDFMKNDPDFDRSDYLENYFKAYEVGGKLYEIVPVFDIITLFGKASRLGEEPGWTMEEFNAITENLTGREILGEYRKDYLLNRFLYNCSDSYIDRNKGKCYFDSDEFISVLKFCNKFLDETPEYGADTNELMGNIREDRQLMEFTFAGTPMYFRTAEKGYLGKQVTFKGYPSSKGNGSSFYDMNGVRFAISSKTAVPDGAWKFVKAFLSDEYQDMYSEQQSSGIPIKLSSLEKKFENEQKPFEYIGGDGKTYYEEENRYYTGGGWIDIGYPDAADAERAMEFLKSIETVQRRDRNLSVIVQEEAGAYFAGQKSAEEVAKTIQNRVQNYLDESR
ncbi:MAG: extracellular solute-binding protein [Oscillospiraceae bacterium]|nr:extracellular solute-binding protein [Oscillospiraceae bacterium]